jgi:eukaryotic-like serine/threonine-protein kinase
MTAPSSPPFTLPSRYEFKNIVLKGGQGDVYVCLDTFLDRLVAIKCFHNPALAPALAKEIDARAKIKSKHVVELYDRWIGPNQPLALLMEYVDGTSLHDPALLPNQLDGLLLILYQIASGIADIHAAGVIHRDIKPLNMRIDASGIVKIFDLGIANLDADDASTVGGAGTYVFRAPELYSAPVAVTMAVDVYAIGVTAWWLLSKNFPPPLLEVPPQHSGATMPSLASAAPGMKSVTDLLDQTLNINPSTRPTSAELRDALAAHIVHDRRRGVFSHSNGNYELTKKGSSTNVQVAPHGSIAVAYSSSGDFVVRKIDGAVFVNNASAAVGGELPSSCVLTFGASELGGKRKYLTFNVSQPEIVL